DLTVIGPKEYSTGGLQLLRVRSQSLKSFCLWAMFSAEIDAPRLGYMSFRDDQSDMIVDLSKIDAIHDFLIRISSVRHMIISHGNLDVLNLYFYLRPIPNFHNLYRLEAAFPKSMEQFMPVFLESCPNLRNLILEEGQTEHTYVPQCLVSTLECEESWKKIVRYFLENSVVLKKLLLRFRDSSTSNRDSVFKKLLTFYKAVLQL
ncbi:hypothetical protein EUTSA_v100011931mg, partial [Eutrema salsugineum]